MATAAEVGDTIRLPMSNNTKLTGVLTELDAQSLSLTDFRGARHNFPTSQIGLFEVQKVRPVGQRIAIGAGLGALSGMLIPYVASAIRGTHSSCDRSGYCHRSYDDVGDQAAAGALAGALIGGSIGIAVPWHDWRLVRLEFGRR
jgi:hypothetical protein